VAALEVLSDRVFRFRDACNVFVLTAGAQAILIDLGTGAVLHHLDSIGVASVEWVLLTHHHRDQSAGSHRLAPAGIRLAVPAREASWFEAADASWQSQRIFDLYDCTNVFDRPLADSHVDRRLEDYERFAWEDLRIEVLPTPGHTKGSVTYLVEIGGSRWAFSGDLLHSPGRVWTLHDLHWNYSDPDALDAELHSVQTLRGRAPDRVAPSHGDVIDRPREALDALEQRLRRLLAVVGGRFIGDLQPRLAGDVAVEHVSPHLLTVRQTSANFHVLLGSDGRALFFDYGFPGFLGHVASGECRFVEHTLSDLEHDFGVESVEVVVATHYHDDHVAGFGYLRDRFGTAVWALDVFADVLARPWAYRLPATWREPVVVDRQYAAGDTIEWEGYSFVARHLPGHTWYAGGLFGEVDGRRIAVTGDEIQLDGGGALRGGGPVFRNRFRLDSFRRGIDAVREYEPEVLLTGHDGAVPVDREALEKVRDWAEKLEGALAALAPEDVPVGIALDPGFASFHPYQARGWPGQPLELCVEVTNHHAEPTTGTVRPVVPAGWQVEPGELSQTIESSETARFHFRVTAPDDAVRGRRNLVAADVELAGRFFAQPCEAIVTLGSQRL
jgi:glyoxylase-like metal-dependent hydrolase (beta-lactamase superfamily II)